MKIHFYKYQGAGNDFIMIDNRTNWFPSKNIDLINKLCNRNFGIGADGLILLNKSETFDFTMFYANADGSESTMCGNGGRCIVAFAKQLNIIDYTTKFNAIDGEHHATIQADGSIKLQMNDVITINRINDFTFELNTGSPHYVIFKNESLESLDIITESHKIRYNETYKTHGINVNFVWPNQNELVIRTYERGVENETLACGTGATAAALCYFAFFNPDINQINLQTRGGKLTVFANKLSNNEFKNVWLCGAAQLVFEGTIEI